MKFQKLLAAVVEKWPVKVLSVTLAVVLVVFRQMNMQVERYFTAPLRVIENGNMVPANALPKTVRVALRGTNDDIYPIVEEDVEVYLDLTRYTSEGSYRLPVQIRKTGTALSAASVEIRPEPADVGVTLDKKTSKYVPVRATLQGKIAPGCKLVSTAFNPAEVLIDGPASLLDEIASLPTSEIDINGRGDDFSQTVSLGKIDPLVTLHGNGVVDFRAIIRPNIISRAFEKPIEARGLDPSLQAVFEPPLATVHLEATENLLTGYTLPEEDTFTVDLSEINGEGTWTLPLTALITRTATSSAITVLETTPAEVTVHVTLKPDEPPDEPPDENAQPPRNGTEL